MKQTVKWHPWTLEEIIISSEKRIHISHLALLIHLAVYAIQQASTTVTDPLQLPNKAAFTKNTNIS